MENYRKSIHLLLKRLSLLIISYTLLRILFLVFQWNVFDNITFLTFLGGVRFDLSIIFYTNALIIAAHTIPGSFKYSLTYQASLKVLFFIINSICMATNFVDIIYFSFTGKRSTIQLITADSMHNEILKLIPSFAIDYWYIFLLSFIFIFTFWKCIPTGKFDSNKQLSKSLISLKMLPFFLFTGSSIIFGRGGLQKYPLRRVDAIKYSNSKNSSLVLNTPFCILKTIGKNQGIKKHNFLSKHKLDSIYNPIKSFKNSKEFSKKNVVIIILESFGNENISYLNPKTGNTPFLDSLISKSLYFKNGFANGRVSIDALPSVISGIPSLIGEPYIKSSYAFNDIETLPKILNRKGYSTSFFHGAINGSQNFDQYTKIAGIDKYYGKNEYPEPEHDDGCWGIFDEEYLQYFGKQLTKERQPFFSTVFTLSSHNPFIIPKKYKGKFKKGTTNFFRSIGYSDYALANFFKYAKKENWYKNTIFILTADHTSSSKPTSHKSILDKYAIPIIFFDPLNSSLKGTSDKNIQQIDILPSVLNYLNYNESFNSYGFSYQSKNNMIINLINGNYHVIIDSNYCVFNGKKIIEFYKHNSDKSLKNNILKTINVNTIKEIELKIKAYLQSFNQNIIDNTMIDKITK